MSSTPSNQNSKPTTPPKTMGWTRALFGVLSSKKTSYVDPSTGSTALKTKNRPSPKPFQNLEGFNSVSSPDQANPNTPSTTPMYTNGSGVSTPNAQLQQEQKTPTLPSKSPWKSSPNVKFSVGNLKPAPTRVGPGRGFRSTSFPISSTARVAPAARPQRRRRYKTSGVFQVRRNHRGAKAPMDKTQMNNILKNARPALEGTSQSTESFNNNFRTFANKKVKPGVRLNAANRNNGRLPNQAVTVTDSSKFVANGKRTLDSNVEEKEAFQEPSVPKKRKVVNFGVTESVTINKPIENIMATPAKDTGSFKRKATPYKSAVESDVGTSENDSSKKPVSDRKILTAKRSPPSKMKDTSPQDTPEEFPEMPQIDAVGYPFSNWIKTKEGISSASIMSNKILDKNFMANFLPKDEPITLLSASAQFDEEPLFRGPKKDRTVPDENDDDDSDADAGDNSNAKRTKLDESSTEPVKMTAAWGNTFAHHFKGMEVKCPVCMSFNSKTATKCISCDGELNPSNDSAGETSSTTANEPSKPPASAGSITSGGFSFGGSSSSSDGKISSSGFSFGTPAPTSTTTASSSSTTGGFSFGAPSTAATSGATSSDGFKFGAASSAATTATSTSSSTGFNFGATDTSKSPSAKDTSATSETATGSSGGFKFGAASTSSTSSTSGGFSFGATSEAKASAPPAAAPSPSPAPAASGTASKPFSFGAAAKVAATSSSESKNTAEKSTPPPSTATANSGAQLFGNFASSTSGLSSAPAPSFSFGASSTSKTREGSPAKEKRKSTDTRSSGGFSFSGSTTKDSDSKKDAPTFSFGSNKPAAEPTTAKASTSGFSFGSGSDAGSSAPSASSSAAKFSFGTSSGSTSTTVPPLGSIPSEGKDDGSTRKKRRGRDDASDTSSSQPAVTFGSKPPTGAPAANPAPAPFSFGAPTPAAPSFGSTTAPTPAPTPAPAAPFSFGSTSAPAPGPATGAPAFGSTSAPTPAPTPAPPAFSFGAAPTPASAPAPAAPTPAAPFSFGSTSAPAPTPAAPFSFGSTSAPPAPSFGATAPTPSAPMAFGSTPAPNGGFGSTPASNGMNFGSSTPAPAAAPFGSTTPAATPGFGTPAAPAFGSTTPAPAFGSAPAAPQPFGNTSFGSSQPAAPSMTPGGFGAPAPNAGFSLGSGGGPSNGRTPGGRRGRRIVRARRPGGQR